MCGPGFAKLMMVYYGEQYASSYIADWLLWSCLASWKRSVPSDSPLPGLVSKLLATRLCNYLLAAK